MTKAIYSSPFIPPEYVAAYGIEPLRIFSRLEKAASLGISKVGMCPYVRAFMSEATSIDNYTIVLMATTCDQMRRAADILGMWHGHPARGTGIGESGRPARSNHGQDAHAPFLLNIPATWQTASAFRLYYDELKRLGRFLQMLGGIEPSKQKLIEKMLEYDSRRQAVLAQKHLLSARQYAEMLTSQKEDNAVSYKNPNDTNRSGIPIALVGGPLLGDDLYILDLIEEAGARVALNAMEYGERTFPREFDRRKIGEDSLLELADAYFSTIPDAFRRPNSELYIWLKERLEQEKVKGVIFHHYIWCDIWHAELGRFKEWTNLPVLDIHAGDNGASVRGKMRDLIQTFIQMLK